MDTTLENTNRDDSELYWQGSPSQLAHLARVYGYDLVAAQYEEQTHD
jgi:hypothetical protein